MPPLRGHTVTVSFLAPTVLIAPAWISKCMRDKRNCEAGMTAGTEGSDVLTNDEAVQDEVIDAFGGDDHIIVTVPRGGSVILPTIAVNGGDGFDTLELDAVMLEQAEGSEFSGNLVAHASSGARTPISWTSIERLELSGKIPPEAGGH